MSPELKGEESPLHFPFFSCEAKCEVPAKRADR